MLTKKQNGLLLFIKDYIERHGFGPTYAEMSDAIGMRSIGPSQYIFNQLAELGYVIRLHGKARAVRVLRMPGDLVENKDYAARVGATKKDVQAAIDKWYPHALATFGKADSKFSELAVAFGIRRWGNEELRQMYIADIDPQIEALGLTVPTPS